MIWKATRLVMPGGNLGKKREGGWWLIPGPCCLNTGDWGGEERSQPREVAALELRGKSEGVEPWKPREEGVASCAWPCHVWGRLRGAPWTRQHRGRW